LRRSYPEKVIDARIVAIKSGREATARLNDAQLEELEQDVRSLAPKILGMEAEDHTPVWKPLCERCDFRPLCNRHPDFPASIPVIQ
jgi:hypothetical protein